MPHNTVRETGGIYWQFYGRVSAQEIEQANSEMYSDPKFDTMKYFICDMSDVISLEIDSLEIDYSVGADRGASYTNRKIKGAMVAISEPINGIINDYIKKSKKADTPWKLRIFSSLEKARKWVSS